MSSHTYHPKAHGKSPPPQIFVSGTQTLRPIPAAPPKFAGIDPYNEWIDRDSDDNIIEISDRTGS